MDIEIGRAAFFLLGHGIHLRVEAVGSTINLATSSEAIVGAVRERA